MTVKVRVDKAREVFAAIRKLTKTEVLVGIPGDGKERDPGEGEPITNAELGYIHEFGSPKPTFRRARF